MKKEGRVFDLYSKIMLTVIAACLVWLCIAQTAIVSPVAAQVLLEPPAHKDGVIDAKAFRIVNDEGDVRAMLTLHPSPKEKPYYEDKVGLYLYGRQSQEKGRFIISDDRAQLSIQDGKGIVELGVTKCQPNGDQGGYVTVVDAQERRALFGVKPNWDKPPGPASSLMLFEARSVEPYWQTPMPAGK